MTTVIESAPPQLPISYARTASNASTLESMQLAHQTALASFNDGRPASFPAPSAPPMYNTPQHSIMASYRSFSEVNGNLQNHVGQPPQIYTAVYSGVSVYEMEINGIAVMRRRSDSWLNATQILKVAGVDKGKRTKVLEKEILTGEHEKVQGGYGKYQGTWINYRRGREFCRQYGVEDILRPLLDYDISTDGSSGQGQGMETPTKEQAMAANRKRMYTATLDGRAMNQNSHGTFFSNISSTASNALAAMNKVARLNSPAPRRPGMTPGRPQQPPVLASQDSFRGGSQQSMHSFASERSVGANGQQDSGYGTQGLNSGGDMQEPPQKRVRLSNPDGSFTQANGMVDLSMRDGTPTEPNESFVYQHAEHQMDGDVPVALAPLPHPTDKRTEEKQGLLLDLFADLNRTDFSTHPAIIHLSGSDLDLPLDQSANTALHWAATLARVSLMRLLISKGANIFRGNIAGQTPLMAAVQVNNSLDHSCFPELLEILGPLIEVRDAQGRTILHHIAVSCGIKGRAASSKYYLEALLEFLVRSTSSTASGAADTGMGIARPIGLMRFMSEMVNARDKAGNTALNLVARIGNRSIIQQLLEVQADPMIPNYKGLRPVDFGVGTDAERPVNNHPPPSQLSSPNKTKTSRVEETSKDLIPALTSSLSQSESQFAAEIRLKQDQIDRTNTAIRELSATQKAESAKLAQLQHRLRMRQERGQKVANLRRTVDELRQRSVIAAAAGSSNGGGAGGVRVGDADAAFAVPGPDLVGAGAVGEDGMAVSFDHPQQAQAQTQRIAHLLPPVPILSARLRAYAANNESLRARAAALKARNGELEASYRKVVALCTGVPEDRVEETLGMLLAAVESEGQGVGTGEVEVGRVREFLRKVEGVGGGVV